MGGQTVACGGGGGAALMGGGLLGGAGARDTLGAVVGRGGGGCLAGGGGGADLWLPFWDYTKKKKSEISEIKTNKLRRLLTWWIWRLGTGGGTSCFDLVGDSSNFTSTLLLCMKS